MVKLEETTDEHFQKGAAAEDGDEWQDDDESDFVRFASLLSSCLVVG